MNFSAQVGSWEKSFCLRLTLPSLQKKQTPNQCSHCAFFLSPCKSHLMKRSKSSYFPKVSKSPYLKLSLLRKLQPTSASAMFGIILGNTKQEHFSLENIPQKRCVFGTERSVLFHSCREPSVERRCSWEVARVSAASPLRRADLN